MQKASQEGVIILFGDDGEPDRMVRRNGEVVYYKLTKMGMGDHIEMWGADSVQQ